MDSTVVSKTRASLSASGRLGSKRPVSTALIAWRDTPTRFARWWREFIDYDTGSLGTLFESVGTSQLVVVSDIQVWSLCEHHLLPFNCSVTIAYRPTGQLLGLSKFARVAHQYAHRLQVQERLVDQIALEISPHVFVRPGELRRWEWEEIDWENAFWDIPPEKMKRRIPLRVPLSRQVQAKILRLWDITGGGKYLFPSFRTPTRPMSENTINAALRALGYGPEEMTAHGFRSMANSLLNECGRFSADAIERQLAHQDKNSVRRIYMRAEFWAERVRMMQFWSDYLEQLRDSVEPIRAQAKRGRGRPAFGGPQLPQPSSG